MSVVVTDLDAAVSDAAAHLYVWLSRTSRKTCAMRSPTRRAARRR